VRSARGLRVRLATAAAVLLIALLAAHSVTVAPTAAAIPPSQSAAAAASQLPARQTPSGAPAPCDAACPQDCAAGVPGCDAQLAPAVPDAPRDVPVLQPAPGTSRPAVSVLAARSRPAPAPSPLELSISRT
jgi:hypothetical protein